MRSCEGRTGKLLSLMDDRLSHSIPMQAALEQARLAAAAGEVPIGAVVCDAQGRIIGRGHNAPIANHDPTAHAEIQALRQAAACLGNYRLDGCRVYITLEPCTMCAGAMLHARVAQVIYAVPEPRTGAAGSVIDPFAVAQLNHQTRVLPAAGLGPEAETWAQACAGLLQGFFRDKRKQALCLHQASHPLRQDALRTPDGCFAGLALAAPAESRYTSSLPALAGLRLHYLEAHGPSGGTVDWLLLHGHPGWSAGFTKVLGWLQAQPSTRRILVPDLVGFGRSDKPKKTAFHHPALHARILVELLAERDLQRAVVLGQGIGAELGLDAARRASGRVRALWRLPQGAPWPSPEQAAFLKDLAARPLLVTALRAQDASGRAGTGPRHASPGGRQPDPAGVTKRALPPQALAAPWPDKGHQAAFVAMAAWARVASSGSAGAGVAQAAPQSGMGGSAAAIAQTHEEHEADASGCPIVDPAAFGVTASAAASDPWAQPDDLLAASDVARAAAYFGH